MRIITLQRGTNVNHAKLTKYLNWLEERSLIQPIIEKRKIYFVLTKTGREVARILLEPKLVDQVKLRVSLI